MVLALALAVGLVLADSSVVTLALPAILRELDTSVGTVAWVLIAFNLALALAAVPGSRLARARGRPAYLVALVLFALASLACASASSMTVLIAARGAQGVFGAVVVAAALDLLSDRVGGRRAVSLWAAAGVLGAAVGPALGGMLTEAFSWQAMFALQAPVALVALAGARRVPRAAVAVGPAAEERPSATAGTALPASGERSRAAAEVALAHSGERPPLLPLVALALLSAALAAALFLLVVLLIEGWQHSPAEAALTVTVMPIAALLAGRYAREREGLALAAGGCLLVAGGLAALGLLPGAGPLWTVAPQLAIGAGLGLALAPLVRETVGERGDRDSAADEPAAWTISARHVGIVAGLLILTPIFTAGLEDARLPAERAGLARLLDAPLSLSTKIDLARALGGELASADDQLPDLGRGFDAVRVPADERRALTRLRVELDDGLDRAGTHAFSSSFLAAAVLALLAAGTVALAVRSARRPLRAGGSSSANGSRLASGAPLAAGVSGAAALAALLVAVYVALGGGSNQPRAVADPCAPRARPPVEGTQRAVLAALDGGACRLRTTREDLLLALLGGRRPAGVSEPELVEALLSGVDRARAEGALGTAAAAALRLALRTRGTGAILGLLLKAR